MLLFLQLRCYETIAGGYAFICFSFHFCFHLCKTAFRSKSKLLKPYVMKHMKAVHFHWSQIYLILSLSFYLEAVISYSSVFNFVVTFAKWLLNKNPIKQNLTLPNTKHDSFYMVSHGAMLSYALFPFTPLCPMGLFILSAFYSDTRVYKRSPWDSVILEMGLLSLGWPSVQLLWECFCLFFSYQFE